MIKFFRNYIVEIKTVGQNKDQRDELKIIDFNHKIVLFSASYPEILQFETGSSDDSSIYI